MKVDLQQCTYIALLAKTAKSFAGKLDELSQKERKITILGIKKFQNPSIPLQMPKKEYSILTHKLEQRQVEPLSLGHRFFAQISHILSLALERLGIFYSIENVIVEIDHFEQIIKDLPQQIKDAEEDIKNLKEAIEIVRNYSLPVAETALGYLENIQKQTTDENRLKEIQDSIKKFEGALQSSKNEDEKKAIQDHLNPLKKMLSEEGEKFQLELNVLIRMHKTLMITYPKTIENNEKDVLPKLQKKYKLLLQKQQYLQDLSQQRL